MKKLYCFIAIRKNVWTSLLHSSGCITQARSVEPSLYPRVLCNYCCTFFKPYTHELPLFPLYFTWNNTFKTNYTPPRQFSSVYYGHSTVENVWKKAPRNMYIQKMQTIWSPHTLWQTSRLAHLQHGGKKNPPEEKSRRAFASFIDDDVYIHRRRI